MYEVKIAWTNIDLTEAKIALHWKNRISMVNSIALLCLLAERIADVNAAQRNQFSRRRIKPISI